MANKRLTKSILFTLSLGVSLLGNVEAAEAAPAASAQAQASVTVGEVFPPLSYEQALSSTTNAMSQVSGHPDIRVMVEQTEANILESTPNPTTNQKRAAKNARITIERFTALTGRKPHDNSVYLKWMAEKGCTGSGSDWSGCEQLIVKLRAQAVEILDKARQEGVRQSHIEQAEAFLWWADNAAPYADVQVALLTAVVTSLPEKYWLIYFPKPAAKIVPKSLFERLLEDRANNRPSFEGRAFGPHPMDEDSMRNIEGKQGCIYREGDPPSVCGKISKRGKTTWQVGQDTITTEQDKGNKALLTIDDGTGEDISLLDRLGGTFSLKAGGGLIHNRNLNTGRWFSIGIRPGVVVGSFEGGLVLDYMAIPVGLNSPTVHGSGLEYNQLWAIAGGAWGKFAPWFTKHYGIGAGVEVAGIFGPGGTGGMALATLEPLRLKWGGNNRRGIQGFAALGFDVGYLNRGAELGTPREDPKDPVPDLNPANGEGLAWKINGGVGLRF